jgi:16S rRNA processing protein RimM
MLVEDLITIGKIIRAQGNKGQVRFISYVEELLQYANLEWVYLSLGGSDKGLPIYYIEKIMKKGNYYIIQFAEFHDRTGAENLVGAEVKIRKEQLKPLPEGQYYWFEIEGLQVYQDTGTYLGTVKELFYTGSNDVYVVSNNEGKEILLPATREVVKQIDLSNNKMIIHLLEGLI